jgi:glycogen operon protein
MWIDGSNSQSRTRVGELITDHSWLLLVHADDTEADFVLPGPQYGATFEPTLDTTTADGRPIAPGALPAGTKITLPARSLLLLRAPR